MAANIAGVSTLGMKLGYAVEAEAGQKPESFIWLERANSIGAIDLSTETIDASALEDPVTRTIAGRQDTGGEWTFTFNLTNETEKTYQEMLNKSKAGLAESRRTWFVVWFPNLAKSFVIVAQPGGTLPMSEIGQNELLTCELTLALDEYKGLMADITEPKEPEAV